MSASSEKAYKVGDKRVQAVINAEVSQFPDALSEAKKAQQQYVIAKQRGSQDLTTKVDGATTSVKLADEELQKFQAASLPSSWTGGINNAKEAEAEEEFVPDVKYEKSRDGRYNSFMETLSKPALITEAILG